MCVYLYIWKTLSLWSSATFYVENAIEKESRVLGLIIKYILLNEVLQWIRYPTNMYNLKERIQESRIYSKIDMKFGLWQTHV